MKPQDHIIEQLIEQQIEFKVIHYSPIKSPDSELNKVVSAWKNKFIGDKKAPYLSDFLWHIFSYQRTEFLEKEHAVAELKKQFPADTYIFNQSQQYLIKCRNKIPMIQMNDFFDDIYISHHNMKWTYVIPHEAPYLGPYFSIGT